MAYIWNNCNTFEWNSFGSSKRNVGAYFYTSIKQTEHYAKVLPVNLSIVMEELEKKSETGIFKRVKQNFISISTFYTVQILFAIKSKM
jgi:hypothetical protein